MEGSRLDINPVFTVAIIGSVNLNISVYSSVLHVFPYLVCYPHAGLYILNVCEKAPTPATTTCQSAMLSLICLVVHNIKLNLE